MDSPNAPQSALDVLRTVEFKLGLKGYNVDDVDDFLERAAIEAEHLKEQLKQQQQQLRQAAERISQLEGERRSGSSALPNTPPPAAPAAAAPPAPVPAAAPVAVASSPEQVTRMISLAQQFVDQTQLEAETHARNLTAAAQDKAREIVSEAQNRAQDEVTRLNGLKQRLSEDVERLSRQVETERQRLKSQLGEFLRWVEENFQSHAIAPAPEPVAIERPVEAPQRELSVAPTAPPVSASTASSALPTAPPPAPPRAAPTTIGQVLNFDTEERT